VRARVGCVVSMMILTRSVGCPLGASYRTLSEGNPWQRRCADPSTFHGEAFCCKMKPELTVAPFIALHLQLSVTIGLFVTVVLFYVAVGTLLGGCVAATWVAQKCCGRFRRRLRTE